MEMLSTLLLSAAFVLANAADTQTNIAVATNIQKTPIVMVKEEPNKVKAERMTESRHVSWYERSSGEKHRSSHDQSNEDISWSESSSEEVRSGRRRHGREKERRFIKKLMHHLRIKPNFRVCPLGWHGYGTHCYLYVHFRSRWTNAERNCLRLGGNLASVHSLEQYGFLLNVIDKRAKRDQKAWIGGNDAVQEGFWVWSDGSRFHFPNWSRGQPSDSSGRRENCLEMNYGADRGLNDAFCWHKHPFVCSRKL